MASRWRRGGRGGGRSSSRTTRMSAVMELLLGRGDEQDSVDLVDLDELHLDALAAGGRQVLAHVVGADRELAVAAVGEDGELHALGAAVVEQGLDRGADRAAGVEDVVEEADRAALEREVEPCRADERLGVLGRLAPTNGDVVTVERDVDGTEVEPLAGTLLDEAAKALRQRDAARVDADEGDAVELGVALDQ